MIPSLCRATATTDSLLSLLNVTANLAKAFLDSGIKVLIIYQNMQNANILYNPFKAELLLMHFWVISIEKKQLRTLPVESDLKIRVLLPIDYHALI